MSDDKHTPGPWRIPNANVFRVVAPEADHTNKPEGLGRAYPWRVIADTEPGSNPNAAADARLIAAAPALGEALESLMESLEHNGFGLAYAKNLARRALAMADGPHEGSGNEHE